MEHLNSNIFNFYDELKRNFNSIIPSQEDGLIIFTLYTKVKLEILQEPFSHENIVDAIEIVYDDLGKATKNNSPTRNNEIVRRLLNFFIRKIRKGYVLREYAIDFCKLIESELSTRFNPSQVEIKFKILYVALKESLANEEEFEIWYNSTFEKNKNEIKKQLEILHNSVELTIKNLNLLYNSDEINFLEKLREMDLKVKELVSDTHLLEIALQQKENIISLLNAAKDNTKSFAYKSEKFREIRKNIRSFSEQIQSQLSEISYTIDRIKPQLDRLFGSLEQREFDRKIEKLVYYIFKNSFHDRQENGKEEISLPEIIQLKKISSEKTRLIYPFYYDFMSKRNVSLRDITYNEEEHDKQFLKASQTILNNQKAVQYYKDFILRIKSEKTISYSDYFFSVLETEQNLEVVLKMTHLILKELSKNNKYKLDIQPDFISSNKVSDTAIWKTSIQNLNF